MRREIWKGDILVADIEELEIWDASEIHARRLAAKEVLMPKSGDHFKFPIADGPVTSSGREQVFRKSTSIQETLHKAKSTTAFLAESRTGLNRLTRQRTTVKPATIFGRSLGINYFCRHHVEPRVELHVPKEPIPLRFFDVVRRTNTTLDVLLESRADDYLNVDGDWDPSEEWTSFTHFTTLNEKIFRRRHVVREAADKNSSKIKTRSFLARDLVRTVESSSKQRKTAVRR